MSIMGSADVYFKYIVKFGQVRSINFQIMLLINPYIISVKAAVEYKGHSCAGYNVGGSFFNFEKNIVSGTYLTFNIFLFTNNHVIILLGSEDKKIYIYDTQSGELVKELENPHFLQTVVHLVQPINSTEMSLVSASIDNVRILY